MCPSSCLTSKMPALEGQLLYPTHLYQTSCTQAHVSKSPCPSSCFTSDMPAPASQLLYLSPCMPVTFICTGIPTTVFPALYPTPTLKLQNIRSRFPTPVSHISCLSISVSMAVHTLAPFLCCLYPMLWSNIPPSILGKFPLLSIELLDLCEWVESQFFSLLHIKWAVNLPLRDRE